MVGVGGGRLHNRFYSNDSPNFTESNREVTNMDLGQAIGRLEFCSLDNMSYPTSGSFLNLTVMQTLGRYVHDSYDRSDNPVKVRKDQHWFQAEVKADKYFTLGNYFSLGMSSTSYVEPPLCSTHIMQRWSTPRRSLRHLLLMDVF